jgi:heme A synthase
VAKEPEWRTAHAPWRGAFTGLTLITYLLVVLGAVVRARGAGLACPDWPLCFGELVPALDFGVILEWGHRALAGSVSILLVGLSAWLYQDRRAWTACRGLLGLSFVVLAVQVVLGGLTVLKLLASWTVTSHLLVGNLFGVCLTLLSARLFEVAEERDGAAVTAPVSPTLRALAWGVAGLYLAQMTLGGLVSSRFAGLVCPQWPACAGDLYFSELRRAPGVAAQPSPRGLRADLHHRGPGLGRLGSPATRRALPAAAAPRDRAGGPGDRERAASSAS